MRKDTGLWHRIAPLDSARFPDRIETWEYVENGRRVASFEVDIRLGKPLDVMGLKNTPLTEVQKYAEFLHRMAHQLYAPHQKLAELTACPICGGQVSPVPALFEIFGVGYKRCATCGHVFVGTRPHADAFDELYTESEEHSAVYTDKSSLELRLSQIVTPKFEWALEVYKKAHGRHAASIVDVGAGGGHFVEVSRRAGLYAEGYEISEASRRFAQEVFGIKLRAQDYLYDDSQTGEFDIVSFWGLLEYVEQPRVFLDAAHRNLSSSGMVVVEVPRFDGVSSAIQRLNPDRIARHLDPTSHVNCFSDSSLVTALYACGFRPVAAWYFGLDAYELLVQLALHLELADDLDRLADMIPCLQEAFDFAHLCDDIIIAAIPDRSTGHQ